MSCFLAELHYVGIFKPAGRFRPRGGGRHGGRRTLGDRHFLSLSYSNRQLGSITVLRDLSHPVLSLMQIPQSNYSANLIPFVLAAFDRPDVSRVQLLVKPGLLEGVLGRDPSRSSPPRISDHQCSTSNNDFRISREEKSQVETGKS